MVDFQKKKKIRKVLYSPAIIGLLLVVFLILVSGVWGVHKKAQLSAQNLEREKMELQKLAIREKNLTESIDYLKTDQGVENEIRTKFKAVKDGEQVALIIDNQIASTTKTATSTPSFWYKIFHWPQ